MDDITQERPNKGPILNFHKIHYRQSLSKTFVTNVKKSMVLEKINSVSFLEIKLFVVNLCGGRGGEKYSTYQKLKFS